MNMDREQEPLDQDTGLDGDSEQGWYFDLPKGAWERQEQKNRELRDRVLRNIQSEPDRTDPYAARRTSPQPEEKGRGGIFGIGKRKAEPEKPRETPGGTWRLNRGGASFDNLRPLGGSLAEDPDDYSTEPPVDIQPIPLRLRSRENIADNARPPGASPDDATTDDGHPPSHWDDAFASPADGGMLQGMASWATDPDGPAAGDDQPRPRRVLRAVPNQPPPDSEPPEELEAPAEDTTVAATFVDDAVGSPAAEEPQSTWGQPFGESAGEPTGPDAAPDPAVEEPAPAFGLKLHRRSEEEAETTTETEPGTSTPRSRWDEVFSAPAGDAGMLDSMRAWASKPVDEEEPAPRRMLADPDDETDDHDIVSGHATVEDMATDLPQPKKRGLFGRMFGRKAEQPQTPEATADKMAWLPAASEQQADPAELPSWVTDPVDNWDGPEATAPPAAVAEEPPVAAAHDEDIEVEATPAATVAEHPDRGGWEAAPDAEHEPGPAWMRNEVTDEQPEAPWMLPTPVEEPEDEPLVAGHASVVEPAGEIAETPRKKGLFGRMFGRKEHAPEIPATAADETPAWTHATDSTETEASDELPWVSRDDSAWEEPESVVMTAAMSDEPTVPSAGPEVSGFEEEPATPWMLHAPEAEPEDEPLVAGHASIVGPAGEIADAPRTTGLFGHLFGRSEQAPESSSLTADEPPSLTPVTESTDTEAPDHQAWVSREDSDWEEPDNSKSPADAWQMPSAWSAQAGAVVPPAPLSPPGALEYSTETPDTAPVADPQPLETAPWAPAAAWDTSSSPAASNLAGLADEFVAEETAPAAFADDDPLMAWEPEEVPAEPAFTGAPVEPEPEPATTEELWEPLASVEAAPPADAPVTPLSEAPEKAPGDAYDDPWANFDLTADRTDAPAPEPASATAAITPAEADDDPWASFIGNRQPEAPTVAKEETPDATATEADDPWAAITADGDYDPTAPIGFDKYRRSNRPGSIPAEDAAAATPEAAAPLSPGASPGLVPDWARGEADDEDDTILKAFEAHASAELDEERSSALSAPHAGNDGPSAFEDLLGEGGNELVSEVTEPENDHNAFSRLQGWAPQRNLATGEVGAIAQWTAPPPALDPSKGAPDGDRWSFEDDDDNQPPWVLPRTSDESAPVAVAVRRGSRARTLVRELIETGLLALLVFLAVRASFQNFKVDGSSMFPTLENGQFLIVNKLVYSEVDMDKLSSFVPFVDPGNSPKRNLFHGPERGDIIVLRDPRKPDTDLIKRVIGLPGETIEIVNDEQNGAQVYINDHLLQEPYLKAKWHDSKPKVEIPEGYYFVMGDNRDYSLDSRSQQVGVVSKDNIIGKAMLSYWPRDKMGLAPNEAGNISEKDGRPQLTARRVGE